MLKKGSPMMPNLWISIIVLFGLQSLSNVVIADDLPFPPYDNTSSWVRHLDFPHDAIPGLFIPLPSALTSSFTFTDAVDQSAQQYHFFFQVLNLENNTKTFKILFRFKKANSTSKFSITYDVTLAAGASSPAMAPGAHLVFDEKGFFGGNDTGTFTAKITNAKLIGPDFGFSMLIVEDPPCQTDASDPNEPVPPECTPPTPLVDSPPSDFLTADFPIEVTIEQQPLEVGVPTLSEYAMLLLILLIAGTGFFLIRIRPTSLRST